MEIIEGYAGEFLHRIGKPYILIFVEPSDEIKGQYDASITIMLEKLSRKDDDQAIPCGTFELQFHKAYFPPSSASMAEEGQTAESCAVAECVHYVESLLNVMQAELFDAHKMGSITTTVGLKPISWQPMLKLLKLRGLGQRQFNLLNRFHDSATVGTALLAADRFPTGYFKDFTPKPSAS